jgi:hypothetical protein
MSFRALQGIPILEGVILPIVIPSSEESASARVPPTDVDTKK